MAARPHGQGQPGLPAAAGAPACPPGRQDRLHGRAAPGRARTVLPARPGPSRRRAAQGGVDQGSVAVGEEGVRLGKGGGFADLEYALASAAGLIGLDTVVVTTVHELQVCGPGSIPATAHAVPVDLVVTPERVIDCRGRRVYRPTHGICWDELTEEKIAAIPLLAVLRSARG